MMPSSRPGSDLDLDGFVRRNTLLTTPPLVPEIRLHLATEVTALWHATEDTLERNNLPPPYWAFAWPGGQAVARYVLDHPESIAGRVVLDFAAGSGLVALAAARAGAARAIACDIDRFAASAMALNAAANGLPLEVRTDDLVGSAADGIDTVLAGDVCYERPMADRILPWFRSLARDRLVVIGDPGRAYVPRDGIERLAEYDVPTPLELEDREIRRTFVARILPA